MIRTATRHAKDGHPRYRRRSWDGSGFEGPIARGDDVSEGLPWQSTIQQERWEEGLTPRQERTIPESGGDAGTRWPGQYSLDVPALAGAAQLQQVAAAVDEILLKRTQLLNQFSGLRDLRTLLEASFQKLDTLEESHRTPPFQRPPAVAQLLHPYSEALSPADSYDEPRPGRPASADALGEENSPSQEEARYSPEKTRGSVLAFKAVVTEVRQQLDRVWQQEIDVGHSLQSLSTLEYRLNDKQKALARNLKDAIQDTGISEFLPHAMLPADSLRSTSDIPSVVDHYFERRGDVGIWTERREELLEAWAEGITERALISDRGDPLDVSEADFTTNYQERLKHIQVELENAETDAEHLWQRCEEAGHNVEQYRTRPRSRAASFYSERITNPYSLVLKTGPALQPTEEQSPPAAHQPIRRIDSWLRDVPESNIGMAEEIIIGSSAPQTPRIRGLGADQVPLPPSPAHSGPSETLDVEAVPPRSAALHPSNHSQDPPVEPASPVAFAKRRESIGFVHFGPRAGDEYSIGKPQSVDTMGDTAPIQFSTAPTSYGEPSQSMESPSHPHDQSADCEDHG